MSKKDMSSKTAREIEIEFLATLPSAPYSPSSEKGVLLSDEIQFYVDNYRLIEPFKAKNLKTASYELRVGARYSVGGTSFDVTTDPKNATFVIPPFDVAIIQTFERVNLPTFLIARWNLRVKWAYEGLMWVGGPQVDAGYKGYLFCPIYNLSDKPVTLNYGDEIAQIDFATTTRPGNQKAYPQPADRKRVVFGEYSPEMQSALAELAKKRLDFFSDQITAMQTKMDTFVTIMVAAIAIVVGAVSAIAAKPDKVDWTNPTLPILATITFGMGLASIIYARSIEKLLSNGATLEYVPKRQRNTALTLIIVFAVAALVVAGTGFVVQKSIAIPAQAQKTEIDRLDALLRKTTRSVLDLQMQLKALRK